MIGSPYVWILTDAVGATTPEDFISSSRIMSVVNGALIVQQSNIQEHYEAQRFERDYRLRFPALDSYTLSASAAYAYDAVWVDLFQLLDFPSFSCNY
jgi:hypothetical protein